MSLPERRGGAEPVTQVSPDTDAIIVNPDGEAFTDFTRNREVVVRSEALNALNPVVKIDLGKVVTTQNGPGVAIVIQDFGLPPRIITINGGFPDIRDIQSRRQSEAQHPDSSEYLDFDVISPEMNGTYHFDDKMLPAKDDGLEVIMGRGETMLWAHDGVPSDERTGYIGGSTWELIALLPEDYWGQPDFSDISETDGGLRRGYVPLIGMSYEGNVLSIHSLDDTHAEVQYQQLRSLADDLPVERGKDAQLADVDPDAIIRGIVAGDTQATEAVTRIVRERKELADQVEATSGKLAEAARAVDSLETSLAVNKGKLGDARREVAHLAGEVAKLKRESRTAETTSKGSIFDILNGRQATEQDPHGYCAQLGLSPDFLFALDSESAAKVVRGVYRGLANAFHPDGKGSADTEDTLKAIGNVVDSVLQRLEQGYWGRK